MSYSEKSVQDKEPMSYQEKETLLSLVSSIVIFGGYCLYIFQRYREQIFNAPDDLRFWATTVLIFIPVSIVASIIINIVFNIIHTIVTKEEQDPAFTDERDKLIELKALQISHWTFILGFFLAMGSQVLEMQAYVMFMVLVLAGFVSGLAADIAKFYFYRKGF